MLTLLALIAASTASASQLDHTISNVESMVWDQQVQRMVARQGLTAVNVSWEDTGRYKGSSVGPNISDMTIGVRDGNGQLHPMPVIRFDNFNDKTADLSPDDFWLRVGNEDGGRMHSASLSEILHSPRSFLHDPESWTGRDASLWDKRDDHVLVSAQACFLPVPKGGQATFTPVIYNYQSSVGNPAVLTIVATREGTSMQIVDNDEGYMSEVLYFNQDGERAPFTATRLSDFKSSGGDGTHGSVSASSEDGLNTVLLIQVPLKHDAPVYDNYWGDALMEGVAMSMGAPEAEDSDVEAAVIGHGPVEGPFTEIGGLDIERDSRFPVRVTVQFYKATSNGVVTDSDIADIRKQIDRVYSNGDYVGTLVSAGHTGRPTEWVEAPERAVWAKPDFAWLKAF